MPTTSILRPWFHSLRSSVVNQLFGSSPGDSQHSRGGSTTETVSTWAVNRNLSHCVCEVPFQVPISAITDGPQDQVWALEDNSMQFAW